MKKLFLPFSLLCLFFLSVLAGCATTVPKVDPATFTNTKWNQVISFLGEHNTLEFIDDTTVIYTFYGEPKKYTYKVAGDKIRFSGDTYTIKKQGDHITSELFTGYLKHDTLLLRGNPHWIKE